jgi:hypothetical protein
VGFLDNLRTVQSWAREAAASQPKWARIVKVGRRIGPLTQIELEVHHADEEPFHASSLSWVPRGVEPKVGQHVAYRVSTGDSHTAYEILWDQAPQYGRSAGAAGAEPPA